MSGFERYELSIQPFGSVVKGFRGSGNRTFRGGCVDQRGRGQQGQHLVGGQGDELFVFHTFILQPPGPQRGDSGQNDIFRFNRVVPLHYHAYRGSDYLGTTFA